MERGYRRPGQGSGTVSARRATVRSHRDAIRLHDGIARACARAGHPFVASSRAFIMWTQIWTPRFRHHTINRTILQSYQCIDRKKEGRRGHHLYRRETIHRTAGGASVPVRWVSGKYPDRPYRALMGSSTVFTAWDGDRLAGLVRVLDDSAMMAYMHYVVVDPAYQGHTASPVTWSRWSRNATGISSILK